MVEVLNFDKDMQVQNIFPSQNLNKFLKISLNKEKEKKSRSGTIEEQWAHLHFYLELASKLSIHFQPMKQMTK